MTKNLNAAVRMVTTKTRPEGLHRAAFGGFPGMPTISFYHADTDIMVILSLAPALYVSINLPPEKNTFSYHLNLVGAGLDDVNECAEAVCFALAGVDGHWILPAEEKDSAIEAEHISLFRVELTEPEPASSGQPVEAMAMRRGLASVQVDPKLFAEAEQMILLQSELIAKTNELTMLTGTKH